MAGCFKLVQIATLAFLFLPCIVQVLSKKSKHKTPKPNIEEKVERFVKEFCKCKEIKGLTLAVVKDDQVRMTKGFGYKNLEIKEEADEKTLFGIASLTKAFAAATLVKILLERSITLSTPLNEFVNVTFPTEHLNTYANLEDLLAHRTGLAKNNYLRFNTNFTRRKHHKFLKDFEIKQDFRTGFLYNNVMYGLASYITEILTGMTWEDAVDTYLLKPLGMDDTKFSTTADSDKLNLAYPYLDVDGKGLRRISPNFSKRWGLLGGSGAMLSNAPDMARWMRFLLNKGELDGEQIVNASTIDDIFKGRNHPGSSDTTFMRPNTPITFSNGLYSLGWRMGYYRGFPIITHTGSTWGYKAMLTLFPTEKLGIFNAQIGSDDKYVRRRLLHSYIADQYLGEQPWLNHTSACSFPRKTSKKKTTKKRATRSAPKLNKRYDFAGLYSNQLWGDIRFEMTRKGLKMVYGWASLMLTPTSDPLSFKGVGFGELWFIRFSSIIFETDGKNEKKVISVSVPSFEKGTPPKFIKMN